MEVTNIFRSVATIAVASLALGMAACSSSDQPSATGSSASEGGNAAGGETQEIEVWFYPVMAEESEHRAFWDAKIEEFQKANPDIKVKYEIFPWANRDEAIQTALAGGVAPDLIYLVPDQLAAYEHSIEPMDAYLPAEQKDALMPSVVESLTTSNGMLGAPILVSAQPLVCNKQLFEEAQVELPKTWDDMLAAASKLAEKDKYLLAYYGSPEISQTAGFYPLLWQAGGEVFSEDLSSITFNDEAGVEALTFLKKLRDMNALDPDTLTATPALEQTGMATGKTACSYAAGQPGQFAELWGEENVAVLPHLENKKRVGYGTIGSISMFNTSEAKEAAGKFASFATSQPVVDEYVDAAGFFSPLTTSELKYEPGSLQEQTQATLEYNTLGVLHPRSREVMGMIAPEIQAVLLEGKDPKAALDAAAEAAKGVL